MSRGKNWPNAPVKEGGKRKPRDLAGAPQWTVSQVAANDQINKRPHLGLKRKARTVRHWKEGKVAADLVVLAKGTKSERKRSGEGKKETKREALIKILLTAATPPLRVKGDTWDWTKQKRVQGPSRNLKDGGREGRRRLRTSLQQGRTRPFLKNLGGPGGTPFMKVERSKKEAYPKRFFKKAGGRIRKRGGGSKLSTAPEPSTRSPYLVPPEKKPHRGGGKWKREGYPDLGGSTTTTRETKKKQSSGPSRRNERRAGRSFFQKGADAKKVRIMY